MVRVLLLGHSFIRRLMGFMNSPRYYNLRLDRQQVQVDACFAGGARLDWLRSDDVNDALEEAPTQMVVMQIGTNDLDKYEVDIMRMVDHYRQYAEYLFEMWDIKCVVKQIHPSGHNGYVEAKNGKIYLHSHRFIFLDMPTKDQ